MIFFFRNLHLGLLIKIEINLNIITAKRIITINQYPILRFKLKLWP